MSDYFQRLRNIEADAASTRRALAAYVPGGMGHRILTGRLDRLRADWRTVEAERRQAYQDAIDDQTSPNGVSVFSCH